MRTIAAPLNPGDQGAEVANLQAALLWLYTHGVFKTYAPPNQPTAEDVKALIEKVTAEQASQTFGDATQQLLRYVQIQQSLGDNLHGFVEASTAAKLNQWLLDTGVPFDDGGLRVFGTVRDTGGSPQEGVLVSAFDRDLRRRQLLGQTKTDAVGNYLITYPIKAFASGDAKSRTTPWLIVEAQRLDTTAPAASAAFVPSQVSPVMRVDLEVPSLQAPVAPELIRLMAAVLPLLVEQGEDPAHPGTATRLAPDELTSADWPFLMEETGFGIAALEAFANGARIARAAQTMLPEGADEDAKLLNLYGLGYFFAMARQLQGSGLTELLQRSDDGLTRAWSRAVVFNQVPPVKDEVLAGLIGLVGRLRQYQQIHATPKATHPVAKALSISGDKVPAPVALTALEVIEAAGQVDPDEVLSTLTRQHPDQPDANALLTRGLRLYVLTDGDPALMNALQDNLTVPSGDNLAPLAAMSASEWVKVAATAGASPEAGVDMQRRVELEHPVHALQMRLEGGHIGFDGQTGQQIQNLLDNRPEQVEVLIGGKTAVMDAKLDETEGLLKSLGTSMRLGFNLELAGHFASHGYLKPTDFMHADIETLKEIGDKMSAEFNTHDLIENFRESANKFVNVGKDVAVGVSIHGRSPGQYLDVTPIHKELSESELGNLPDMPSLFGDLDECGCRPCESMLGQPAYLVDLLELLRQPTGGNGTSPALDALIGANGRRKDIAALRLNCEISEATWPHIALAIEVLKSKTTDVEAKLASAAFPWQLPCDLQRVAAASYFAPLGIDRDVFLRLLDVKIEERTAASLGLPYPANTSNNALEIEWSLLTKDFSGNDLWHAYGLPATVPATFKDPASETPLGVPTSAAEVLNRLSVLLDRTGLDFDTFLTLISTRYVGMASINTHDHCKTSAMTLTLPEKLLDDAHGNVEQAQACVLNRIHRLVRLKTKFAAWTFDDLDKALAAIGWSEGVPAPTPAQRMTWLTSLAGIGRMADRHHLPVGSLCRQPFASALPDIANAIGLRPFQFELLARLAGFNTATTRPDWVALEACLLLGEQIQETRVAVEALALLLLPPTEVQRWLQPMPADAIVDATNDRRVDECLTTIRQALRKATDVPAAASVREAALSLLRDVLSDEAVTALFDAIDRAAAEDAKTAVNTRETLPQDLVAKVSALFVIPSDVKRALGSTWPRLMSEAQVDDLLAVATSTNDTPRSASTRNESLLAAIQDVILSARREQSLMDSCSLLFQGPPEVCADYLRWNVGNGMRAHGTLLDIGFWGEQGRDSEALQRWSASVMRLMAFKNRLGQPSLYDLVRTRMDWSALLNVTSGNADTATLAQRIELIDALWLGQAAQLSTPVLNDLFEALDAQDGQGIDRYAQALTILAGRIEWPNNHHDATSLAQLAGSADRASLQHFTQIKRTLELMLLAKRLRATGPQLEDLRGLHGPRVAKATAETLLARRQGFTPTNAAWTASDAHVQCENRILGATRDALVAYLIQESIGQFRSPNDLYEHHLIDPMVEPCMKTTKVLEAITAVQLFCQRLLFGLEAPLIAPDKLREQWTWMRNYRVWEANRKVFLFPENWLYPELRDDRSSSFELLQSELGRGELTHDESILSFGRFLSDVAAMGGVKVLTLYEDLDGLTGERRVFVVGRSANPSYKYYWRTCRDFGTENAQWAPWQHIELEIEGDHLLAFTTQGSLWIAWPKIQRLDVPKGAKVASGDGQPWGLSMFCSRFDGRRWSKPEISRDPVAIPPSAFASDREGLAFRVDTSQKRTISIICFVVMVKPGKATTGNPPQSHSEPDPQPPSTVDLTVTRSNARTDGPYSTTTRVTWEAWVKIKPAEGNEDSTAPWILLAPEQLDSTSTSVTLEATINSTHVSNPLGREYRIGSRDYRHTQYVVDEEGFTGLETDDLPIGLNQVNWTGRFKFGGISLPAYQVTVPTARHSDGNWKDHVVVQFDGSAFTVEQLGIDLGTVTEADEFAQFTLMPGSAMEGEPSQGMQLSSPMGAATWMNGFREKLSGSGPCTLPILHGTSLVGTRVFNALAGHRFLVVPSASIQGSTVWHFEEGESAAFIDGAPTGQSGFQLLPSTFPEAYDYLADWYSTQTLAQGTAQAPLYGVKGLPSPGYGALNTPIDIAALQQTNSIPPANLFHLQIPNACYSWEIFLHAPMLIADQLSKQHKFEDAERWLRYIFDPTSPDTGQDARRFFHFRPFKELDVRQQVIDDLKTIAQIAGGYTVSAGDRKAADKMNKIIERWRAMPFRPFVIARGRIVAFLWRTLFAYLDNLIAWADSLYRQDTRESNNEAMMLYVMARKILSRRPQVHNGTPGHAGKTYEDMVGHLDDFANYWVDTVSRGSMHARAKKPVKGETSGNRKPPMTNSPTSAGMLLFCMPFNDKLNSYWNTVEGRLFNLRHCRNMDGVERELPFTEAPIDPELLVRAVAAGLNLGSVIAGLYAPPPHYRYATLAARANELVAEAKSLGSAMLSAIEKRDAEQLAQLRSANEQQMLKLNVEVRKLQIREADANITALRATRLSTAARYVQYQRLLGLNGVAPPEGQTTGMVSMLGQFNDGAVSKHSGLGLIKEEDQQYFGIDAANTWAMAATIAKLTAGGFHAASSIVAAAMVSVNNAVAPKVVEAIGNSASAIGDAFTLGSQGWRTYADQQGMLAGHLRRRDEWAFQSNQTLKELQQIDKQILANQIRIDITQKELSNHLEQIEQSKAVDEVLHSKFSNADLYEWMGRELYGLYDKTYRMAQSLARQAERAFERELGPGSLKASFIRNDQWRSQRDGLLAAEQLHHDLKQLELAYLDQNQREFELTKHISLRRLDPEALVNLRVTQLDANNPAIKLNQCEFELPEWLLDLDTPGHYLRRIKSVSVSIPCVSGPYTSVHAKLTLLSSSTRVRKDPSPSYGRDEKNDDPRFEDQYGATEAIVTSMATADSGMFEAQLRDERFLPFEGRGVISHWRLELPADYPQFDYSTISDVVLTVRYTARDGGGQLKALASKSVEVLTPPADAKRSFKVMLSCRTDFPEEWNRRSQGLNFEIRRSVLPYWMSGQKFECKSVSQYFLLKSDASGQPKLIQGSTLVWTSGGNELGKLTMTTADLSNATDIIVLLDISKKAGT